MPRKLPPLNALRAFEAAARQESFTRAAAELHVTQGAVSHQVKALERHLGLLLFRRERQRLFLTDRGRDFLETVRDAFDRIATGTERLLRREKSGALTVSMSPNFAAKWMVHRLDRFLERHPGIELRIGATVQHIDFARDDADLAIRHGDGDWPSLHVTRLCAEELFAVCSPALLRKAPLRTPADLRRHTLIHLEDERDWRKWLEAAGAGAAPLGRGVVVDQRSMAIDAAVDGQGVALARTALAAWELLSGRLVRPLAFALPAAYAYWIVCPKATAARPKIAAFRDWALAEARNDEARLAELFAAKPKVRAARPIGRT